MLYKHILVKSKEWRPFKIMLSIQKTWNKAIYYGSITWFYEKTSLKKKILKNFY